MSRHPRHRSLKVYVEALESRQLLSGSGVRSFFAHAAAAPTGANDTRPDLDAFARTLALRPGQAARMGLGGLAEALRHDAAYAAHHGWGATLVRELSDHPAYAAYHHLKGLIPPARSPALTGPRADGGVPTPPGTLASPPVTPPAPPVTPPAPPVTPLGTGNPSPPTWLHDPTIAVGATLDVTLPSGGLSGPNLTYTITPQPLPPNMTFNRGTGELVFAPAPWEVGSYLFAVTVSNGTRAVQELVPITVTAPAVASTEVSGQVVDEAGQPLAGIPVTIDGASATTDARGDFTLAGVAALPGPLRAGGAVAEAQGRQALIAPVDQLLGRPLYADADNVVSTPLILPKINWSAPAPFRRVDSAQPLDLTNPAMPGFAIHLAPGTGQAVASGTLALATLPAALAAQHLPPGLKSGMVLYKAAGVDLTQPVRLTVPNTQGYLPGARLNLLTVNLKTGGHDVTGQMVVSADGQTLTSTGLITLAHPSATAVAPDGAAPALIHADSAGTVFQGCLVMQPDPSSGLPIGPCKGYQPTGNQTANTGNSPLRNPSSRSALASDVGMVTGEYFQDHSTATYQSLGQVRGLDLQYSSAQANPNLVAQYQFTTPDAGDSGAISSINAQISLAGVIQGPETTYAPPSGFSDGTTYNIPLQVDASSLPTGVYPYTMTVAENFGIEIITTLTFTVTGFVNVVNTASDPLGAGWSIGGLQHVAQLSPDGAALVTAGQQGTERFDSVYDDGQTYLQDLALASDTSTSQILTNDGLGHFSPPTAAGSLTVGTVAGDFNGDDRPDLAIVDTTTLTVPLNNGAGGLTAGASYALPSGYEGKGLAVGNFTGHTNGVRDLAVLLAPTSGSGYAVAVYTGNGDGTFAGPVVSTAGNGTPVSGGTPSGSTPDSLVAGDFNGDGLTDLAFTTDDGLADVMLTTTGGALAAATPLALPSGHTAFGVTTLDYNGDAVPDLVVEVNNANLEENGAPFTSLDLFTGAGAGGFSFTSTYQTVGQPDLATLGLVAGAFGGAADGLEVAVPITNGGGNKSYIDIVPLDPAGTWGAGVLHPIGGYSLYPAQPGNIVAADLNGTGKPSIALTANVNPFTAATGQIELLLADPDSNQMLPVVTLAAPDAGSVNGMLAVAPFTGHAAGPRFRGPTSDPSALLHNADGTWTRSDPDGTVLQFNAEGQEVSEADRNGNTTVYAYVPAGQPGAGALQTVTDPVGLVTTLTYDAADHLSAITDPASRVTTITVDPNDNLTQIIDPDNAVTQYGYANPANHALTTETNPNGHTATAHYDRFGLLTSETLFDGTATTTVNPAQGQGLLAPGESGSLPTTYQAGITDPNGHATTIGLSWMSHITSQTDANNATTTTTYDHRGFPSAVTDPLGRTTTYVVDANGHVTSITRPGAGDYGGGPETETITYDDPYGVPTAITDFNGHTTTFTLDPHGNVLRRTDPDGGHEDWTYNTAGQVLTDTDRTGATTTYHYDTAGRLDQVDHPAGAPAPTNVAMGGTATASADNAPNGEGAPQAFDQDPATKWLAFSSAAWLQDQFPNGAAYTVTQYQLTSGDDTADFPGRAPKDWQLLGSNDGATWTVLDTQTDQADTASGDTRTYTVAAPGSYAYYRLNITASNGDSILQLADLALLAVPAVVPALAASSVFYGDDPAGNVTSTTDERGHVWSTTYDALNRVLTTQDPVQAAAAQDTAYTYDPAGNLLTVTDALGHVTSYTYDARDRVTGMTDPANQGSGRQTTYAYDPGSNLSSVTDPLGHVTSFIYDPDNRLSTVTDALGHVTAYAYDTAGELTAVTDPNDNTTNYGYDGDSRLQTVTLPDTGLGTATTTYAYDPDGDLTSVIDANSNTTTYSYDLLNRLITVTDANANTTRYGHDADGRLSSVTDPLGHATLAFYDVRGRRAAQIAPAGGGTTLYAYDATSNLTSLTDPVGNVTAWAYDDANRATTATDPLNHVTSYVHDLVGNLTQTTDRDGRVIQYGYDADDRPTTETWVGASPPETLTTTYDAAGRVATLSDAFSQYTYTYDDANRLTTVDNQGTPGVPHVVLTAGYDPAGNRTSLSDSLGGVINATYDARNELTSLSQSGTGVAPQRVDFAYDPVGDLTTLTRYSDLDGLNEVVGTTLSYDPANRLTGITHQTASAATVASYAYTLDAASRLTQEDRTWAGGGSSDTVNYGYTDNNQVTSVTHTNGAFPTENFSYDANGNRAMAGYTTGTGNRLTSDGTYTYGYDDEGNLTSRTEISTGDQLLFTYDDRNRLTAVDQVVGGVQSVVATYTYDALDRRIGITAGGTATWTVYDGSAPLLDFNGSGTPTARYLNGPSAAGVDAALARETPSGGVAWYLPDRLGTVRDLVDNSGTVLDHVDYGVFGNVQGETNPSQGDRRVGFAGLQRDPATGLNFARHRVLLSSAGIWTSQDPWGFHAGDDNLYRYVGNGPTNADDPTGSIDEPVQGMDPSHNRPRPKTGGGGRKPTPPFFDPYDPGDYIAPGFLYIFPNFRPSGGSWSYIPEYDHNDPDNPFPLPSPGTGYYADALQTPAGVLKIPGGVVFYLVGCTSDGRPIYYSDGPTFWFPTEGGGANPFGDNPNTTPQIEPSGPDSGGKPLDPRPLFPPPPSDPPQKMKGN